MCVCECVCKYFECMECVSVCGVFLCQLDGETCKEVFTIGLRRTEPCLQPLLNGNTLVLQDENQVWQLMYIQCV